MRHSPDALGSTEDVSRMPEISRFFGIIVQMYVTEWAALHRAELMEDWNLARAEAQLKPIAPLE